MTVTRDSYEYALDLTDFGQYGRLETAEPLTYRPAQVADTQALAELMIEAYRGTIDYDDETVEDAVGEVEAYLAGERGGRPLLPLSVLAFDGELLVGTCLTGEWDERELPIIAYMMTHADWKGRGLGRQMLETVLAALHEQGYQEVRAVITEGNVPSERLFGRLGFRKLGLIE